MGHKEDPVNPEHYTLGDIEAIDAIKAALTDEQFYGLCIGNAIGYLWRAQFKGRAIDIQKAIWYSRMAMGDDPRSGIARAEPAPLNYQPISLWPVRPLGGTKE